MASPSDPHRVAQVAIESQPGSTTIFARWLTSFENRSYLPFRWQTRAGVAAGAARQQGRGEAQVGLIGSQRWFHRLWCLTCLSRRAFRVALISVDCLFQPAPNGLW